jgi:hypothetical protein
VVLFPPVKGFVLHILSDRFALPPNLFTQIGKYNNFSNIATLYVLLIIVPLKVLLSYVSMWHFNLFSIDKHASSVCVIYPLSVPPSLESKMIWSNNMQLKLQIISIYLSDTLALAQPGHVDHQLVF